MELSDALHLANTCNFIDVGELAASGCGAHGSDDDLIAIEFLSKSNTMWNMYGVARRSSYGEPLKTIRLFSNIVCFLILFLSSLCGYSWFAMWNRI